MAGFLTCCHSKYNQPLVCSAVSACQILLTTCVHVGPPNLRSQARRSPSHEQTRRELYILPLRATPRRICDMLRSLPLTIIMANTL